MGERGMARGDARPTGVGRSISVGVCSKSVRVGHFSVRVGSKFVRVCCKSVRAGHFSVRVGLKSVRVCSSSDGVGHFPVRVCSKSVRVGHFPERFVSPTGKFLPGAASFAESLFACLQFPPLFSKCLCAGTRQALHLSPVRRG